MKKNESLPIKDHYGQDVLKMYESVPDPNRSLFTEHHHTEIEICYVKSGSGIFLVDGTRYSIDPGKVFVFFSNQPHWIEKIDSTEPPCFLDLKFEPRMVWSPGMNFFDDSFLRQLLSEGCQNCFEQSDEAVDIIRSNMEEMFAECQKTAPGSEIIIKANLYKILVTLLRSREAEIRPTTPYRNIQNLENMDKVIQYINANISKKLSLEELADISCFSRTYFSVLFKELNGVSPWDYINIKRVELAKSMLRNTSQTVLYISSECGFSNLSNFNRIFKKVTGTTPTEFRKK